MKNQSSNLNYRQKLEQGLKARRERQTNRENPATGTRGITLVALVVTIVVLLILAGITITYVFSDNGILSQAQSAANKTDAATALEEIQSRLLAIQLQNTDTWTYSNTDVIEVIEEVAGVTVDEWDDDFYTENGNKVEISSLWVGNKPISTTDSYVGYYADVDGDGSVDGIIYADLMCAQQYDYWNSSTNGTYSWDVLTDGVKEYYISQTDYDEYSDTWGTNDVVALISGSTGENRFYVMALENFTTDSYTTFYWYYNAQGDMDTSYTSSAFGTGQANTSKMITQWNLGSEGWGSGKARDIWSALQTETDAHGNSVFNAGWFIPSLAEFCAFAGELEIGFNEYGYYRS